MVMACQEYRPTEPSPLLLQAESPIYTACTTRDTAALIKAGTFGHGRVLLRTDFCRLACISQISYFSFMRLKGFAPSDEEPRGPRGPRCTGGGRLRRASRAILADAGVRGVWHRWAQWDLRGVEGASSKVGRPEEKWRVNGRAAAILRHSPSLKSNHLLSEAGSGSVPCGLRVSAALLIPVTRRAPYTSIHLNQGRPLVRRRRRRDLLEGEGQARASG
ncbi:hypothetical protein NDU88_001678 [Pleurodeles waltl]|uniref:Uncharacterized protein n=1 Tax=Pleurodeles waltl TaxID=8319 RepID=A0AAV7R996_PLEWA|nr:hypothetical protein NDU88_001678 [Pleurodeles waltl]